MTDAPIVIPGDRLAPVVREVASNAKTIASLVCFLLALFIIAGIAMVAQGSDADSTGGRAQDGGSTLVGLVIWWAVLGAFAQKYLRLVKRSSEVASLAAANVGHQFALDGKQLVASDPTGAPIPRLAFKLSAKRRASLLEIPRAAIVRP